MAKDPTKAKAFKETLGKLLKMPPENQSEMERSKRMLPKWRTKSPVKPGDTLCFSLTDNGVLLDKVPAELADDPFASFGEWSGEADVRAFQHL
jgi:hypothetical protein